MTIQIIGTEKCRDTRKCRRWFDERRIPYHFIDLAKKGLSPGELDAVANLSSWEQLLDKEGKVWQDRQLEWKEFNPREELIAEPLLLRTPVVRDKRNVTVGYVPEDWETFRPV